MTIEVYGMKISAPCRCVVSVLDHLKLPYEFKECNIMNGENKTPEYLKMNPQHTIPTVKDGDLVLNESRAAMMYLAAKAGDDSLYPKDPAARAVVDARLFFDMGTFYKRFGETVYPVMFAKAKVGDDKLEALKEAVGWLQDFVKPTGFAAGTSSLTIADLALAVTYGCVAATGVVDTAGFAELNAWLDKVRAAVPSVGGEGEKAFVEFYKKAKAELK